MKSTIVSANPPPWWHHHGTKVNLNDTSVKEMIVILISSTVDVRVFKALEDKNGWTVSWSIFHGNGNSTGHRNFITEELLGAFGLNCFVGEICWHDSTIDSGVRGKFVR